MNKFLVIRDILTGFGFGSFGIADELDKIMILWKVDELFHQVRCHDRRMCYYRPAPTLGFTGAHNLSNSTAGRDQKVTWSLHNGSDATELPRAAK